MPPKRAKSKAVASLGLRALPEVVLGLHALPEDVLLQVLTHLDLTDRLTLGYTCKRLNSTVAKPSALWRVVEFQASLEHATSTAQWFLPWVHKRAPAVEELHFELTCPEGTAPNVLTAHTSRVWPHMYGAMLVCREKLTKFELTWEGPFVLGPWLVSLFPRLNTVDINAGSVSLEAGLKHAIALKDLSLSAPATTVASLPTSLTSLSLLDCNLSALPAGLSALHQLGSLELAGNTLRAASFAALSSLMQLTLLSFANCGVAAMPMQLSGLTGLEYLYLDDNPGVPVEQLEVLSGLTCLKALGLSGCRLRALPAALSALGELRMLFCHGNRLTSLAESSWLSRLEVLSLSLVDLCCCQDQLKYYAEKLITLYISRSGDPAEQRCAGLLDVLASLPSLATVFYTRSEPSPGRQMLESFEFEQVLHRLQTQTECEGDYIESDEIDWS